jgi:hypothetical protein
MSVRRDRKDQHHPHPSPLPFDKLRTGLKERENCCASLKIERFEVEDSRRASMTKCEESLAEKAELGLPPPRLRFRFPVLKPIQQSQLPHRT